MKRQLLILACAAATVLSGVAKTRKAIYVIIDGVSANFLEKTHPQTIFDVARIGSYAHAYAGGKVGELTETPTISAIGYSNILTGTWMYKHNVRGNSDIKTNYNYWSLFRIAKAQNRPVTTALFSSWSDNRTILIGENLPETNYVKIDYAYDGYAQDQTRFPKKPHELHIYNIDSVVCRAAADCIRKDAPDVSWVYLWYIDDAFHDTGYSPYSEKYLHKEDRLLNDIWQAVRYREKHFDEDWLLILTTDHGREEQGFYHGGQTGGERGIWMASNRRDMNEQWGSSALSQVDILPSICRYMGFTIPRDIEWEQDGLPFFGKADIYDLKTTGYGDNVILEWSVRNKAKTKTNADIYIALTNNFNTGGKDKWIKLATVKTAGGRATIDLSPYKSGFFKFQVVTPYNRLTRWYNKSRWYRDIIPTFQK